MTFPKALKWKVENCLCTFAETEMSLLVIVVDVNPAQRILVEETHKLTHCLDAIVAFTNCHLMLRTTNKLAVLACNADGRLVGLPCCKWLFWNRKKVFWTLILCQIKFVGRYFDLNTTLSVQAKVTLSHWKRKLFSVRKHFVLNKS